MASPISRPPPQVIVITLLNPCYERTLPIIFAVAIDDKQEVDAGFHATISPHISARERFHPATATGKLNAVMTPTIPNGFQISII